MQTFAILIVIVAWRVVQSWQVDNDFLYNLEIFMHVFKDLEKLSQCSIQLSGGLNHLAVAYCIRVMVEIVSNFGQLRNNRRSLASPMCFELRRPWKDFFFGEMITHDFSPVL